MSATRVKCPRPEHAGSRVKLDGTYGKSSHRRQRYKCSPRRGGTALYPRRYALKNRERLNRLLMLLQLHVNGDDDAEVYAKAIRTQLESNGVEARGEGRGPPLRCGVLSSPQAHLSLTTTSAGHGTLCVNFSTGSP
jgi:hypothetical protein